MGVDTKQLIVVLKRKREAEGLSLRKLSGHIGVSFSTLARIERGDGEPDNNSLLRILEWLGSDGEQAGLKFENVALVHFRAAKNVGSKTTECLLSAATAMKRQFEERQKIKDFEPDSEDASSPALALSKPEMEEMAEDLRDELGLASSAPLDALALNIQGVEVLVPEQIERLSEKCVRQLTLDGVDDWSAMSVPIASDDTSWVILRNDRHTLERQRVTYLEECWHILLGHKLTKIAKVGDAYGRSFENSEEHDAYYLASASVLPQQAVKDMVAEGQAAVEIGSHFGVSSELVEYRIKRLGLWRIYKSIGIALNN